MNASFTARLEKDATLRLPPGRHGLVVRVEKGSVLLTQAGDAVDHVLGAGEALCLPRGGLAVAWALAPSALAVWDGADHGALAAADPPAAGGGW